MQDKLEIAYFGIPGRTGGKTHATVNRKPMCGVKLSPRSEFQFCSDIDGSTPECRGCLNSKAYKDHKKRHAQIHRSVFSPRH